MVVTVEYTAQLKRAAGKSREDFELDDSDTLVDLVNVIADRHGDELSRLLKTADGNPQSTVIPFVGDDQVRWDAADVLRDGVTVTLLSPISGG
ncbi:MAG: MoaD/ThiS family protein [Planctomycetota bacterium]|nr:MoaD/ThiS family protein [Planctomycetota bacterium]MDA0918540.1 MoaD/ThiS family protein [Planctomycetota bacterium]MDA1160767.1 MoaD/ThiS family protein [Planctomycetota bacterium]